MASQLPIAVNPSPLPSMGWTAFRQLLSVGGAAAVAAGWIRAESLEGIVTLLMALASLAYGQFKARKHNQEKLTLARNVPDSIAQVKGEPS